MFLVEEEGTASTFRGLSEMIRAHGLPMSLYTDRGAHYFLTPKAARGRPPLSDSGRAGAEATGGRAYPGLFARRRGGGSSGRCTRCRTGCSGAGDGRDHHDRGGQSPSSARSICPPTTPASPSRPLSKARPSCRSRASISTRSCASRRSARSERQLRLLRDAQLQIPPSPMRHHFVKAPVKVHVYPDGSIALFHGPRCIGRYERTEQSKMRKRSRKSAPRRACGRHGQASGLPTPPTGEQKQKKRTFEVLPKPDNLIAIDRYCPTRIVR